MGSPAGATVAFTAGLTFDIGRCWRARRTQAAADAESRKTDLDLLWQEWQTVAKARLLFVKLDAHGRSRWPCCRRSSATLRGRAWTRPRAPSTAGSSPATRPRRS